ncbi:MAG: DUF1826 domain-containing protein [Planctomycetota bacterium]
MTKEMMTHYATDLVEPLAMEETLDRQTDNSHDAVPCWDSAMVTEFANGNADILILPRQTLQNVDAIVRPSCVGEYLTPVRRDNAEYEVRNALRELKVSSQDFAADLSGLVFAFLEQFDVPRAKLRVEITQTQSCPKFHSDYVHIRLVTTYLGPTTEYQYAGDGRIHDAPLGGLVFLKGHRNQTHRDSIHHRSPQVPANVKRLCVAIDF